MIKVEHIIDNDKSLLTILFDRLVMNHLKAKVDDYLNFYQSLYNKNHITIFKADTGYRITRAPKQSKTYRIQVRHRIDNIGEFPGKECTYYLKKNGFIKVVLKY